MVRPPSLDAEGHPLPLDQIELSEEEKAMLDDEFAKRAADRAVAVVQASKTAAEMPYPASE